MKRILYISKIALFMSAIFLFSQHDLQAQKRIKTSAKKLTVDKKSGAQILQGNVKIKHKGTTVYCEKAYYYSKLNQVNAYQNVKVVSKAKTTIYGDSLIYNSKSKVARVFGNVKMIDKEITLITDFIRHDLGTRISSYHTGGVITNRENNDQLKSKIGYFHEKSDVMYFRTDVELNNPDYQIKCDTLEYRSKEKKALFHGPTDIFTKDNTIYCEKGWYNTETKKSEFRQNAVIKGKERTIKGDVIYYDENQKYGELTGNIEVLDTINNIILNGDKGKIWNQKNEFIITENALMTQLFKKDTLFLHADTLMGVKAENKKDQIVLAFRKVRFFKSDFQGKCDSLSYSEQDSLLRMFKDPIIWTDENQISGDTINIYQNDGKIDQLRIKNNALIISEVDSSNYNQIKGKNLIGYFANNELSSIIVNGSGKTVYYLKEEQDSISTGEKLIGMNKAEADKIRIQLKNSKINRISFLSNPVATMFPMNEINEKDRFLKGFRWEIALRPLKKQDVFLNAVK